MAKESFVTRARFLVPAKTLYRDWLDSAGHTAMTGAPATCDARIGGVFSAWDGYIQGVNLELEPGRRIVQSWLTTDFPEGSQPSRVEVLFEPVKGGTEITIRHTDIPEEVSGRYERGWKEYYFDPMRLRYEAS